MLGNTNVYLEFTNENAPNIYVRTELISGLLFNTVGNKDIDTVEVPKICTHELNFEAVRGCVDNIWHIDRIG